MRTVFRATENFFGDVRNDLMRPHPFAEERVGFITVRSAGDTETLVMIAEEYHPLRDEDYLNDPAVGAMMGQEALRRALEIALLHRVGVFHVHMHLFPARRLWFSQTDLSEQLKFVPDFFKVRGEMPHGALVLSRTSEAGRVWLGPKDVRQINEFNVVGPRMRISRSKHDGSVDFEV